MMAVPREEPVDQSYGPKRVSGEITVIRVCSMPSSSAAICASTVCRPWPTSTVEQSTVTLPS